MLSEEIEYQIERTRSEIKSWRADILKAAQPDISTDTMMAERIAQFANQLAETEGKLEALLMIEVTMKWMEEAENPQEAKLDVIQQLMNLMTSGADDTWSGRGNDVRRAKFDGKRETLRDLFGQVKRWKPAETE